MSKWEQAMRMPLNMLVSQIDPKYQLRANRSMMVKLGDEFSTPLGVFNGIISECLHAGYRDELFRIINERTVKPKGKREKFKGCRYFCVYSNELWDAEKALSYISDNMTQEMLYTNDEGFKDFVYVGAEELEGIEQLKELEERHPVALRPDRVYFSLGVEHDVPNEYGFKHDRAVYTLYLPEGYLR